MYLRSIPPQVPILPLAAQLLFLHLELALSKARDSVIICLSSEFGIILFIAEINVSKKAVKVSFGLYNFSK